VLPLAPTGVARFFRNSNPSGVLRVLWRCGGSYGHIQGSNILRRSSVSALVLTSFALSMAFKDDGRQNDNMDNGSCAADDDHSVDVAIVGAGLAGLKCAEMILKKGYSVTVLEARDRVG
jgi:hypothetical protein